MFVVQELVGLDLFTHSFFKGLQNSISSHFFLIQSEVNNGRFHKFSLKNGYVCNISLQTNTSLGSMQYFLDLKIL